jgi:hypothetical protein
LFVDDLLATGGRRDQTAGKTLAETSRLPSPELGGRANSKASAWTYALCAFTALQFTAHCLAFGHERQGGDKYRLQSAFGVGEFARPDCAGKFWASPS